MSRYINRFCPTCGLRLREIPQGAGNAPTYGCRKEHEWDWSHVPQGLESEGRTVERWTALDPIEG